MKPIPLYLVRHAPTAANRDQVFMGQQDVPALPVEHPDRYRVNESCHRVVYTSPLSRAVAGASLLFPGEAVNRDERLLERAGGAWEGLDRATISRRWPGSYLGDRLNPDFVPPGGEPLEHFESRVRDFLGSLRHEGARDVYAVTHNGWIRMALWIRGDFSMKELFDASVPFLVPLLYR